MDGEKLNELEQHKALITDLISRLAFAEACFLGIDKKILPEHAFSDPEVTTGIMNLVRKAQANAFEGCPEINVLEVVSFVDKPAVAYKKFRQILAHWAKDTINGCA
jgi:hypothetical protein